MFYQTELLAQAHDRHRELVAEADRYRLFKVARQRDRASAAARAEARALSAAGDTYATTGGAGLAASC